MYSINQITADPLQTTTIILPNGNPCSMTIYYVPRQIGWYITNFTYQNFTTGGIRITNNPNMLQPWANILQFGLACYSTQDREPTQLQDFATGANLLYILDSSEVEAVIQFYQNGG